MSDADQTNASNLHQIKKKFNSKLGRKIKRNSVKDFLKKKNTTMLKSRLICSLIPDLSFSSNGGLSSLLPTFLSSASPPPTRNRGGSPEILPL
jgi:hypothetical protein